MSNPAKTTFAPWQGYLPFGQALRLTNHQTSLQQTFTTIYNHQVHLRKCCPKTAQVLVTRVTQSLLQISAEHFLS